MKTRDLILSEAIAPGDERAIDLKIGNYMQKIAELDNYERSLKDFTRADHPAALRDKIDAIRTKYENTIKELRATADKDGERLNVLLKAIEKHCSEAIKLYRSSGRQWFISTSNLDPVIYAKTPMKPPTNNTMIMADKLLGLRGIKAQFHNSIMVYKSAAFDGKGRKLCFPLNGFSFARMDRSLSEVVAEDNPYNLFDRDKLRELWKELNKKPEGVEEDNYSYTDKYKEFARRANMSYLSAYDVGGWQGLGSENWETQFQVLQEMINEGLYPKSLEKFTNPEYYIGPNSLDRFDVSGTLDEHYMYEGLITGSYYAIDPSYRDYIVKKLNLGSYY